MFYFDTLRIQSYKLNAKLNLDNKIILPLFDNKSCIEYNSFQLLNFILKKNFKVI